MRKYNPKISISINVLPNWYFSKKNPERFRLILTQKIDFENQILALFDNYVNWQNTIISLEYVDFWLKINCSQMKSLNFANWCNGEVSKSAKIWLSKSIFYIKNHPKISDFFLSLMNTKLGAYFLLLTFFDKINF